VKILRGLVGGAEVSIARVGRKLEQAIRANLEGLGLWREVGRSNSR